MQAALITTPTDIEPFIGTHSSSVLHLIRPTADLEPAVRQAVDGVFCDLEYVEREFRDMSLYLKGIEEPLAALRNLGVGLFAMEVTGTMGLEGGKSIAGWSHTYFLVVPTGGYFWAQDGSGLVHRFSAACRTAVADLLKAAKGNSPISIRTHAGQIRAQFEQTTPWCDTCCLDEIASDSKTAPAVRSPSPRITSSVVEQALADTEALLRSGGPPSAVDRVHTTLHGFLRSACDDAGIAYEPDSGITGLFKRFLQSHPNLNEPRPHEESVTKVMRSLCSVLDAFNPARNKGTLAHPNEVLLTPNEATLFINSARTILQYLDAELYRPKPE